MPFAGEGPELEAIRRAQQPIRADTKAAAALERLGWTVIGRARTTGDESLYAVAEATAACLLAARSRGGRK